MSSSIARKLSFWGLSLGLIGVWLLFRYGMPFHVPTNGYESIISSNINKADIALERRYTLFGYFGLGCLVLGTVLQMMALLPPRRGTSAATSSATIPIQNQQARLGVNLAGGLEPRALPALHLAAKVMARSAEIASEVGDSFSNWLLGGFGAVLALLLANLDKLTSIIPLTNIRVSGRIYIVAAVLALFEKLLALWAGGFSKGHSLGTELAREVDPQAIDFRIYLETSRKAIFPPMRWVLDRQLAASARGDITSVPRMALRLTQVQLVVVFIQAGLIVAAAAVIVFSF